MSDHIIIVSGLPRSGTSLLMQMLAAGGVQPLTDGTRAPDVDNPNGYFEFERVKGLPGDTAWLDEARGKVVKVIHRLVIQLPEGRSYKVVFVERDLDEVIASQAKMLARLGKAGGGLAPERLKAIFAQEKERILASIEARADLELLRVPHAGLISDPSEQVARINTFLGGGLDVDRMAAMVDRSLYRNKV